jgi:Zn-dependent protease with chaperone function
LASDGSGSGVGSPIVGIWHPPRSSRAVAATLHLGRDGFVQARDAEAVPLAATPGKGIEVSDRIGGIVRRISFADGSVFETPDNDAVDALLHRLRRRPAIVPELERFRPRLALFVVLVAALSVAIYRYAVPLLVEAAIALTPPVVPRLLSQSALVSLDQSLLAPSKLPQDRQAAITAEFATIAARSSRGAAGFTLNFRTGGQVGPNAFALPDGTIVLTDELVEMAGPDRGAVFGVLAHEIGHVEREHALRRIYRAVGVAGLIMLIGGDIGAGAQDVLVQGAALVSLSYSREQERDADRYAVELMHAAGRDPMAIVRFFELLVEKLGAGGSADSFLSTHPPTPERIEETRRLALDLAARR